MRLAIVQLASYGDVLISTCIPHIIKKERPKCHITYYTSSVCADALYNNPDIDELEIKQVNNRQEAFDIWGHVTNHAKQQKFSRVIVPWAGILPPKDWRLSKGHKGNNNFMWAYPRAIQSLGLKFSGNIKTHLHLTNEEKEKAKKYVDPLDGRLIMMEIAGHSGQTWWNHKWTEATIKVLCDRLPKFHLFISHGGAEPKELKSLREKINKSKKWQIHYMNHFSIREMAALFDHCDTMFSVSSATANACLTSQRKKGVKWFELVNNTCWDSTPMGSGKFIFYQNKISEYMQIVKSKV